MFHFWQSYSDKYTFFCDELPFSKSYSYFILTGLCYSIIYLSKVKHVLSLWWGYCSGAALFTFNDNDGNFRLLGAASGERFINEKNTSIFPSNSITWLLRSNNITSQDLDKVVYTSIDVGVEYILLNKHRWSVKDYIKENNMYWLPKLYNNENINLLELFADKVCVDQYPGPDSWAQLGVDINNGRTSLSWSSRTV